MQFFSDLHIHSKYSRATSKSLDLKALSKSAKIKGLDILGTGDCLHPKWQAELKKNLQDDGSGILKYDGMNFIFSTEISLMYTQGGKGRRVHFVILFPDFDSAYAMCDWIDGNKWRRDYDGRPIFGFSAIELAEKLQSISKEIELIPAHIMTPFFGLLGSKSGFDSIKECFEEKTKFIHAIETGLSADPEMLWRISETDDYSIVSFSDAHSSYPWKIGREATVFDLKSLTYSNIINAIRKKGKDKISETLEFYPECGKYHIDGHRKCDVALAAKESIRLKGICPKCKKLLTIGVENRIEQLADRQAGFHPKSAHGFRSFVPLNEIIAHALGQGAQTKKVAQAYHKLVEGRGEFDILFNAKKHDLDALNLSQSTKDRIFDIILASREGKLKLRPGYDGVYGKIID
jgi:uncharacterized protein (TIGR00375 family)